MNHQGYYCVAFLDLLGTDAINRSISERKSSDPEGAAKMLACEVGKVQAFRDGFFRILETLQRASATQVGITSDATANDRDALRGNPIKYYTFSDSSIIHCSLTTKLGQVVPLESCFMMLLATALAQLQELARGNPFRGGIEVDFAASHSADGREILGPALSGAVQLEKYIAGFPRVAIGQGFAHYLTVPAMQDDSSAENRLNNIWANHCEALICKDSSGVLSIDVTAPALTRWVSADFQRKWIEKSLRFAREQLEKHKTDERLSKKYEMLVAYLTAERE